MKWFKHFSDNHRGQSVQNLLDELGHTGLCYYILMEMCAEKLDKSREETLTESDCLFSFHGRVVRQTLRISPTTLRRLLDVCATNGLLSFEFAGSSIKISMPILLNLLERNTKKARKTRTESAQKTHLEREVEEEREREVERESSKSTKSTPKEKHNTELNKKVWQAYSDAYSQRYKVEPTRNATVNAQISQLAKRLGEDAIEIIKFYLTHNDGFYLSKTHSIGPCLRDAESLRTQWLRNKPITKTTVRQFEQMQQYEETARHIREHGV